MLVVFWTLSVSLRCYAVYFRKLCFYVQIKVGDGGEGEVGDFLTFPAVMYAYFYHMTFKCSIFVWILLTPSVIVFKVDDWVIPLRDSLSL